MTVPGSPDAYVTAALPASTAPRGILGDMAIPVGLGMLAAPPPVLAPRRKTRQLDVGGVGVGSDSPVSVQSMCTTKTADINATLQQIARSGSPMPSARRYAGAWR